MEVQNNHALDESDIAEIAEIFDLLAQGDFEDHLNQTKLGTDTGPLDPASKGPVLESNNN